MLVIITQAIRLFNFNTDSLAKFYSCSIPKTHYNVFSFYSSIVNSFLKYFYNTMVASLNGKRMTDLKTHQRLVKIPDRLFKSFFAQLW